MSGAVKAVGNAISGVVKGVSKVFSGVVGAVGKVLSGVINFVASPLLGMFGMPDVPNVDAGSNSPQGVLVQRTGTTEDIPVVYGLRKIGSVVTFCETGPKDQNNKYLWVAYALCEGLVEGLYEVWIDDVQIPDTDVKALNSGNIQFVTKGAANCKFAGVTALRFWTGGYFTNPDSTRVGTEIQKDIFAGAPSWDPKMNYNGVATLFARYEWKETTNADGSTTNPFGGSIPELNVVLMGKKVARLTSGTPEAYTYGDIAGGYTLSYSSNPAECLLDYLRNPRYGKGLSNDEIDWESWKISAAKCDQTVTYYTSGTATGPILSLNYVLSTGNTLFNNVQDILKQFRAYMPYSNGQFRLLIEDGGHPTDITSSTYVVAQTFTKDNIQGEITYTGIDRTNKYSIVTVKYVDPDQKWSEQEVSYPDTESVRQQYAVLDGGRENKGEFQFNGITNRYIAFDIARTIFMKNREQDTLSFTASSQALELEVGDIIYVNSNVLTFGVTPGSGTVPWRIVQLKLNDNFTFDIGCVRHVPTVYSYVRPGGAVYKAGLYVPKGATRIYPVEPKYYLGVYPPVNASRVGSIPADWSGAYDASNNPISVNDSPTKPAINPVLTDSVNIFRASLYPIGTAVYADFSFFQPENAFYDRTVIYYKRDIASEVNYTQIDCLDRPGASKIITKTRIGPLLVGQTYIFRTNVRYSTGDTSFITGNFKLTIDKAAIAELDPQDYTENVVSGWTAPTAAPVNNRLAIVKSATATPVLSAGHPVTPRTLSISPLQDIDTYGANNFVNGMTIFYKASSATYWKQVNWNFGGGYTAGVSTPTYTLADFGVPSYPSEPTAQIYDIVLRYNYNDTTTSLYQTRYMQVPVEKAGGVYNFNAFAYALSTHVEKVDAYDLTTESAAPPGSVASTLDMVVGVTGVYVRPGTDGANTCRIFLQPPAVSNQGDWLGVTVFYRKAILGENIGFMRGEVYPVSRSTSGEYSIVLPNIDYINQYEIVLNCRVLNAGVARDANYGIYTKSFLGNDGTPDIAILRAGNFNAPELLSDLLARLSTAPVDPQPVPTVLEWKRVFTQPNAIQPDYYKYSYYQLKVQLPSTYTNLFIYRREYAPTNNYPTYARYNGIGRWEKVTVGAGEFPTGANLNVSVDPTTKVATINLRGPTGAREFSSAFGVATGVPLFSTDFDGSKSGFATKPLAAIDTHEFLLQLQMPAGVSDYVLRLPVIKRVSGQGVIDGLTNARPTKELASTYNDNYMNFPIDYKRRLTDAVNAYTSIAMANATNGLSAPPYWSSYDRTYWPGGGSTPNQPGPSSGSKVV